LSRGVFTYANWLRKPDLTRKKTWRETKGMEKSQLGPERGWGPGGIKWGAKKDTYSTRKSKVDHAVKNQNHGASPASSHPQTNNQKLQEGKITK